METAGSQSVTVWLDRLKSGSDRSEAVARLWERYFARLVGYAQRHLAGRRSLADGEDVALAAFDAFVRAAQAGRFPKLDNRDDLWAILLRLAANKARNAVRDENRSKRGGGHTGHAVGGDDSAGNLTLAASDEPDPAEAAALAEGAEELLRSLGNNELRQIAQLKLEGHTNVEISAAIGKAVATIERKLRRIREIWVARGDV